MMAAHRARSISMTRRRLLFGPRFGRNQADDGVIDDELSVVFAGVLDDAVREVIEASQPRPAGGYAFVQTFDALGIAQVGSVLNALI